jgi:membrane-associated phospholipid phosphatase
MNGSLTLRAGATLTLAALLTFIPRPTAGQTAQNGANVGTWKTWVLTSGSEIAVPAPPADTSDQTKAELAELRTLQALRTPTLNRTVQFWNDGPATRRWTELTLTLGRQAKLNANRQFRALALVHTALHDAVVAAYHAKYAYNRKSPGVLASDLIAAAVASEPSYPSEHAAVAAAAAGVLAALYPKEAPSLAAMVEEAAQTRLIAGVNYRSDVEAGLALGTQVAEKANARAAADGSDAKFTGTIPTGPGFWLLPPGATPVEPLMGSWKPWLLTSGSQFRPGPPPKFGSPEFLADLAEVKRINASVTPRERALATFWAQNAVNGFLDAAYALFTRENASTPVAARVLATLSASQVDALIGSHDAKYTYWQIRPAQADPTIVPVVTDPAHPSYTSNGAALWGVAGEVLAYFYPGEAVRLREMALEGALSRLYAGIHYRSDMDAGREIGRKVSELAVQRDRMNEN